WRAVKYACYRDSRPQSAVTAAMLQLHRALGTWSRKVDAYVALNDFCRDLFVEGGLPPDRIHVKPNFVDDPGMRTRTRTNFLYVGRLAPEKGIATLVEAMGRQPAGVALRVVGTGPEAHRLDGLASVQAVGARSRAEIFDEMSAATAL